MAAKRTKSKLPETVTEVEVAGVVEPVVIARVVAEPEPVIWMVAEDKRHIVMHGFHHDLKAGKVLWPTAYSDNLIDSLRRQGVKLVPKE